MPTSPIAKLKPRRRTKVPPARARDSTVRAPKLSHLVADRLRQSIAHGELVPGAQLPSEAELLRQFGVSRPTLREALRIVESEGLIRLGRGARAGATVLEPSVDAATRYGEMYLATQKTSLGEVHEVRMLLEPSLVARLAGRRSGALLGRLKECVRRQRDAVAADDYPGAVRALNQFHREMLDASENRALSLLAGIVEGIPAKVYPQFLAAGDGPAQRAFKTRTRVSVEAHASLVDLIAGGEVHRAESFWRTYTEETAVYLEKTGLARLPVMPPTAAF